MRRKIPNLSGILAFEAAARRGNFTRAAEDLGLTQSAVSHQIKTLEGRLNTRLFQRASSGMVLTPDGQALLADTSPLLDALETLYAEDGLQHQSDHVRIATYPSLASRWLLPRLFGSGFLDTKVTPTVTHVHSNAQLDADKVDFAILQGDPPWRGLKAYPLFKEGLVLAMSPVLAKGQVVLEAVSGLRHLRIESRPISLRLWAKSKGVEAPNPTETVTLQTYEQLIHGIVHGHGYGVVPEVLIRQELKAGLVRNVFDYVAWPGPYYYLVHSEGREMSFEAKSIASVILSGVESERET